MGKGHRRCEVCGIREALHTGNKLLFSRFPLDPNRCREWLKAVGNEELVHLPIEKLHEQRNVCANHFGKKDFNKKGNRLKRHAIPSLNLLALPLTDGQLAEFPQHVYQHSESKDLLLEAVPSTSQQTRHILKELSQNGKSSRKTTNSTDNSLPLPDTSVPASDPSLAPPDSHPPPSDTSLPPPDTHPPPSDTSLPPSVTTPPLSDTGLAPSVTTSPAPLSDTGLAPSVTTSPAPLSDTGLAPSVTTSPAPLSDTGLAPSVTTSPAPLSDTGLAPSVTTSPAPLSDTGLAPSVTTSPAPLSDTGLAPSVTTPPLSDTGLAPSVTTPPLSDTGLAPSVTTPPLSDTGLAPSVTTPPLSDTGLAPSVTTPPLSDTGLAPSVTTPPAPLSDTGLAPSAEASLSAPTSPSPELPVETSDKALGGFKLGVSEQVLQFRLVDDGDCDEPIYKVVAGKEPETKQETTACSSECNTVLQEEPPTTNDVKSKPEPQENVTKYEKHKDKEYWKLKLTHILHETKFCGICLNAEDGMNALSDELEIVNCETTYRKTLRHIVDCVFKKADYPLANSQVCDGCTNKLIQSYMFIRSAEETAKVLNYHLNELYYKTCYIRNNDLKHKQAGSEIYNVVIALDKEIPKGFDCDVTPEQPRTAESKLDRPRAKRKLRCVSCNVTLPSHRAWRVHETTTHRNSHRCPICLQSFRTRQSFTGHYRTHLHARCSVCHATVRDGRLLQHLRRHRRSVRVCAACDVAFYSAAALARHSRRVHRSAAARCAACLVRLPRGGGARHRCRFACPACGAAACAHRAALRAFRRQALNLAPRAACPRCRYVCSSTQALVAHCDTRHGRGRRFDSSTSLTGHRQRTHGERTFACDMCDRVFLNDTKKRKHRLQVHGGPEGRDPRSECVICQKKFPTRAALLLHLRYHEPGTRFPCRVCRARFDTVAQFSTHSCALSMCEMCGLVVRQAVLRQHMSAHAGGAVTCDTCGKPFQNVTSLRCHQQRHLRNVSCRKCNKSISSVKLWRHLRNHLIRESYQQKLMFQKCNNV